MFEKLLGTMTYKIANEDYLEQLYEEGDSLETLRDKILATSGAGVGGAGLSYIASDGINKQNAQKEMAKNFRQLADSQEFARQIAKTQPLHNAKKYYNVAMYANDLKNRDLYNSIPKKNKRNALIGGILSALAANQLF